MAKTYDVITVGSATMDVFAHTEYSEQIKIMEPNKKVMDLLAYPVGSKILINELKFTTGGGGTNTAVAFSRLGHKVAWLGVLGNDENAEFILNGMKKEKVDILAYREKGFSGYSVILDSIEHDRTILAYKGANDLFSFRKLPLKKLKTKWFYFSSMMDKAFDAQAELAKYAEKNGIKIAFNASTYLAKKGLSYIMPILSRTFVFVLNLEEATLLVPEGSVEHKLETLHQHGPKYVIITDGKKDVFAFDGSNFYNLKPNDIKVIETTGAGDAFASSFVSGLIKGKDIKFALQLGLANAEAVITHRGAKENLLNYRDALKIIKKRPGKIRVWQK